MGEKLTLSFTKITIPGRRPEILSRARLLDKLDEMLEKRLILVTAPAGYGKTSLLIDLARKTKMPVCWFSLDALDQEPQRFISYFIASISRVFHRFGNQTNSALNGLSSLDESLENLVITLVNEIYAQVDEHFIIMLDDYQFVDTVPEIRNFISRFVQLAAENCHLILASRRVPALPDMAILVARQQVGGFDLTELAFRTEEIRLLYEKSYNAALTEAETEELMRRTEGWVTGLHLVHVGGSRGIPDLSHAARAVGVDLSDYFDQQVLSQQAADIHTFLLQTSLLDEFDAALCDSVLGVGNWRAIMDKVRRNNLFVLSVGPRGEWMRYHALFRDYLRKRIQQESPATVQAILLRLAEVSEQNGDWEKAHYAIKQTGDQNSLAALVERAGAFLIQNDRILTLAAWLGELPDSRIHQNPALLALTGFVSLVKGQVKFGLDQNDQAEAMFRARGNLPGLAFTLVQRSWAHRLIGDYQSAVTDAESAIHLTISQPDQEPRLADAYRMKGLALFRLGQAIQALEFLEFSLAIYTRLQMDKEVPQVQMELGMVRRVLGDVVSAQANYEKALDFWQKQGKLASQTTLLNNLGVLYQYRGEYELAIQSFEKGLDCSRRSGYLRSEALILASQGDTYGDIGDLESAQQTYQRAYEIAIQTNDHFLTNYSRIALAGIARRNHDPDRARLLLEDAQAAIWETGSRYETGLHMLEAGCVHLSEGHAGRAILNLKTALKNFDQGGLKNESAKANLWLAAACAKAADWETARSALESVFRSTAGADPPASLFPTASLARAWYAGLVEDEKVGLRLRFFLEQVDAFQKQLPSLRKRLRRLTNLVPDATPDLVIRAFGKPQVRVKGHLLTNAQWKSRTVRELFFYFVGASKPLTKEQVGAILWPESSTRELKLRFKNEMYRLRRAVGQDVILFDGSNYFFNRDLDFEYDVDTFENGLQRARSTKVSEVRLRAYQDAVEAVRGLYLEDIYSDWAESDREKYRREYLDALHDLAGLLFERKDLEQALKICQYAVAADNASEEAYRLMMRIHAARGDRLAVTRQYQACLDTLNEELGMPPSIETEMLYRQLTS